ncbi:MAG: DUF4294 domain-containing protein [Flavobacterium sp.]|nr:DUF4294 domain-containing protein [Flavobacterium sp.]
MKILNFFVIIFVVSLTANAQLVAKDTVKMGYKLSDNDTIISSPVLLQEVIISKEKLDPEAKKQFLLLQNRVWRVYPYAKVAADRLTALNKNMASLQTNREKKKYLKIVENYLEDEFTAQLKKLSRKQGQILVKLIYRQTGQTTFDLIKDYKSGWKAFWSNSTARLFDINLKTKYEPQEINEDYLIETILFRAFNSGRLLPQESENPVDIGVLTNIWVNRKSLEK